LADHPDRDLAERGLGGARVVIAVDQFLTESVKQADVVLPAAGYAEVEGTTTNLEGRVSTVGRKVTAPGTAQPDWVVAAELAARLGLDLGLESTDQIAAEVERVAPSFAGLTWDVLSRPAGLDGVVVGLPRARTDGEDDAAEAGAAEEAGSEGGDREEGAAAEGATAQEPVVERAETAAESAEGASPEKQPTGLLPPETGVPVPVWTVIEPPSPDAYSLRLVVARKLYDRGTLVRSSPSLAELAEPATLRLNPQDFERLGVAAGADVRITSPRGNVTVPTVPDA